MKVMGKNIAKVLRMSRSYGFKFGSGKHFIFLAFLPLIYAPETLPEKVMRGRDLKDYVSIAIKKFSKRLIYMNK